MFDKIHLSDLPQDIKTLKGDEEDMISYNWPSEGLEIWRRVSSFYALDERGNFVSILTRRFDTEPANLFGYLLPRPGSQHVSRLIKIRIFAFALDFGKNSDDPNRGLWVRSHNQIWYKLEIPARKFLPFSRVDTRKVENFLRVYDAVAKFSNYDESKGCFVCPYGILDVHEQSRNGFDIKYVASESPFVLQHLAANIDLEKSCTLVDSIRELGESFVAEEKEIDIRGWLVYYSFAYLFQPYFFIFSFHEIGKRASNTVRDESKRSRTDVLLPSDEKIVLVPQVQTPLDREKSCNHRFEAIPNCAPQSHSTLLAICNGNVASQPSLFSPPSLSSTSSSSSLTSSFEFRDRLTNSSNSQLNSSASVKLPKQNPKKVHWSDSSGFKLCHFIYSDELTEMIY